MKLGEYAGSPCIDVPEEDWREIETTLGLKEPNNEVRKSIARYVDHHLFQAELHLPNPRNKARRKWIIQIRSTAQKLVQSLDWAAVADESDDAWAQMYMVYGLLRRDEQKQLLDILKKLICDADKILKGIPRDKGGAIPDLFYRDLILDLAFLYEWATNKCPRITYNPYGLAGVEYGKDEDPGMYESPFLDFVVAVFSVFAPDRAKGNIALGKHIERVLKVWRRSTRHKDKTPD